MTTTDQPPEPTGPAAAPPTAYRRPLEQPGRAADRCVSRLQLGYRQDNPAAVAELARLRRGAGRTAHTLQDHWGMGGLDELADILGDDTTGVRREHAEEAVYLAVTLWSLHQRSLRDSGMHQRGATLGGAVRTLMQKKGSPGGGSEERPDDPLRKRLVRVGTADTIASVAVRLREIVLLLRDGQVPLDYGRLADQLYRWQVPSGRAVVRREWGREFHLAAPRRGSASRAGDAGGADAFDRDIGPDDPDDDRSGE
ncbi:type I-E CRISPR-associated protein Cse2/CasB [Streptomyces yaizuensis]|uniref:Type I-E CRISPR-associated protein Cse2/CasB n=1 Tax=Streptomyces yaizuensis TaxID=2989713 RepID=A0ABQ5P835_9ACTN|nr:type I-E CRISPR-associated protein Cse2/CasB [Streptomyces sp. YSPA8]GLF98745.1 type I-E CRISPR-associated protein Cse2/CasB [Streptomyces sp. YSPA8]